MILTFTGPTCSGKTTVFRELHKIDSRFVPCISHTTRAPRGTDPAELAEYVFVTREEFAEIPMVESVDFSGNLYGVSVAEATKLINNNQVPCLVLDPNGVRQFIDWCATNNVPYASFFFGAPLQVCYSRILSTRILPDARAELMAQEQMDVAKIVSRYALRLEVMATFERIWPALFRDLAFSYGASRAAHSDTYRTGFFSCDNITNNTATEIAQAVNDIVTNVTLSSLGTHSDKHMGLFTHVNPHRACPTNTTQGIANGC